MKNNILLLRVIAALSCLALLTGFLAPLAGALAAGDGAISLAAMGGAYSQDFDTLAISGTTNSVLPTGWYLTETGGGTRDNEQYGADTGGSDTGDTYSYGAASSTERALGGLQSGSLVPVFGAAFTNNTGGTITSLAIAYTGEQWRLGTESRSDQIDFQLSTDAGSLTNGSWTDYDGLDFVTPVTSTSGPKDGNAAANRTAISATISGLNIPNGASFWIRWTDTNVTFSDDGLAVDDFSLTPSGGPVVEAAPYVASTTPTNGSTAAVDTNISINFSESVTVTEPATFSILGSSSGAHAYSLSGSGASYSLNPASDFLVGETVTVTVSAGQVTDLDDNDPPDSMAADHVFTFSVSTGPCTLSATKISAVQGSGLTSPLAGSSVTVQGVVVGSFPNLKGFYIEEEIADRDGSASSSEGLFVYVNAVPSVVVGHAVRVTGTVAEFGTSPATATQLTGPTITDCGAGETIIPADITFPVSATGDFEAYEGMLVRFPQELFIAEYFNYDLYGEIVLGFPLDGYNRFYTPTSIAAPGAPAQALLADYQLRRITLDDGNTAASPGSPPHPNGLPFSASNYFRGSDTITGQVGVVDHSFSLYRIHPVQAGTYTAKNPRTLTPGAINGTIKVTGYNLLNYFLSIDTTSSTSSGPCGANQAQDCRGADSTAEFNRQRSKLLQALLAIDADVYGLVEVENTPGVDPLGDIVNGLNAATAPGTFARINTGVIGGDAIRAGIIYKPGKVTPVGAFQTIDENDDPRFNTSRNRPSLAQTFSANTNSARFTLVVNHLKSKGSACSGDPDTGDGQGNCNLTRTAAAQALVDWLATDPTGSGDPDFLIVGDLNAYAQEDPITAIKLGPDDTAATADDYVNLLSTHLGPLAYSYVFDGQAGYLDHALASSSLSNQVAGVIDWHINSDEPDIFDYDDTLQDTGESANERKGLDVTDPDSPMRTSDHDPVIIGLALQGSVPVKANTATSLAASTNPSVFGQTVTITATVTSVSGTPGGTVEFYKGAVLLGSSSLNGQGKAAYATSSLTVGTHSPLTAHYLGNDSYNASTSASGSQTVNKASTTTALTGAPAPSVFGQAVVLTATVNVSAPGAGLPAGSVEFYRGASLLGSAALNGSGKAVFTTSSLVVGTHSLTAKYLVSSSFNASTSPAHSQTVNKANASLSLISAPSPSIFGETVVLTATVSAAAPGAGSPTGTVQFYDGLTLLGSASLNAQGKAVYSRNDLGIGLHNLNARYTGSSTFNQATGALASQYEVKEPFKTFLPLVESIIPPAPSGLVEKLLTLLQQIGG